jgi:hypothetical protein
MVKSKIEYDSENETDNEDNEVEEIMKEVIKTKPQLTKQKAIKEPVIPQEEVKPVKKQLSEAKLRSIEKMRQALASKRELKAKEDFEIKTKLNIKNKINRKVQKEVNSPDFVIAATHIICYRMSVLSNRTSTSLFLDIQKRGRSDRRN